MSETLVKKQQTEPQITELILNRPQKRNALNLELMTQLCEQIENISPSQRVLLLRGEGPIFCAGLDLSEKKIELSAELIGKVLKTIYFCPMVTIAAIQGAAIAGGAGLMSACDFVIATEDTRFGYPETRRGLVAAHVLNFLIPQLRQRDIKELLLLGELIDAKRALSMGLINRIVKKEDLLSVAYQYAYLSIKGAPKATRMTKELLDDLTPGQIEVDFETTSKLHKEMRGSEEAEEGISAFLEKREPNWAR